MGCLKLSYSHSAELKIISSKKVLTSKKSENYMCNDYIFGYNEVISYTNPEPWDNGYAGTYAMNHDIGQKQ